MTYSVIIPAYQCAETLAATVESIQASGLSHFEIIIVDDGSTDSTPQVCDTLTAQFSNVRCIHQKNAGVSAARNCGLREATGDYVLFFDADDTVDADVFCRTMEILEQQRPDMLIFGMSFDYYHKGKLYRRDKVVYPNEGMLAPEQWVDAFEALYDCNYLTPVWNKFYRRELLDAHQVQFQQGLFLMEDFLFVLECMRYCNVLCTQPEAIYHYRQAEDEGNAYRRLERILSLSDFMQPFEASMTALTERFDGYFSAGEIVLNRMFYMLLHQKLRFADVREMQAVAEDLFSSRYAEPAQLARCAPRDLALYQILETRRYSKLWCANQRSILRHRVANVVKRMRWYQEIRGNRF